MAAALALHSPGAAAQQAHSFYVLHQRTVSLTAQYWNPILTHVGSKSGVPLELKLAKTAQEGNAMAEAGKYDFLYTNHFFTPERDRLGYKVIARPAGPGIRSQIVVPLDSPMKSLHDLDGKEVAFVCKKGHWILDAEGRAPIANVNVKWFHGTGSLVRPTQVNKVAAVAQQIGDGALRSPESFEYRALWNSETTRTCASWPTPRCPPTRWPRSRPR